MVTPQDAPSSPGYHPRYALALFNKSPRWYLCSFLLICSFLWVQIQNKVYFISHSTTKQNSCKNTRHASLFAHAHTVNFLIFKCYFFIFLFLFMPIILVFKFSLSFMVMNIIPWSIPAQNNASIGWSNLITYTFCHKLICTCLPSFSVTSQAYATSSTLQLTFSLRKLGNLSCSIEIICWTRISRAIRALQFFLQQSFVSRFDLVHICR